MTMTMTMTMSMSMSMSMSMAAMEGCQRKNAGHTRVSSFFSCFPFFACPLSNGKVYRARSARQAPRDKRNQCVYNTSAYVVPMRSGEPIVSRALFTCQRIVQWQPCGASSNEHVDSAIDSLTLSTFPIRPIRPIRARHLEKEARY